VNELEEYLIKISARGDRYGGNGGALDLLDWCGKRGLREVRSEEARFFYDTPDLPYREFLRAAGERGK